MAKLKTVIRIGGMHCVACPQTIEKALKKEVGITNANFKLANVTNATSLRGAKIAPSYLK